MPLTLALKRTPGVPLEVEALVPQAVRGKTLAAIERLPVQAGNRQLPLAEYFSVTGDADDTICWEGDLAAVHWIGAKMAGGRMFVAGNAGRHVGSEMSAGEIRVAGNAGDFLGCQMRGGLIDVRGQTGSLSGGAYRGSPRGMTGGTILIGGQAGDELGHSMRRGLIAVGGSAGELAGCNMLAGSIVVLGRVGIRCGAGMKRGSIVLAGGRPERLLPSFRRACRFRPEVLSLLARRLAALHFDFDHELFRTLYELHSGDLLAGGRGEILVRV